MDLIVHEICTSSMYSVDPARIREAWTVRDIVIAQQMLEWYAETAPDGTDE